MAFTKLTAELNTIELLADRPNKTSGITAQQLKQYFDDNAQTIKSYINSILISEMESSGANSMGIFPSAHFPNITTLQEAIEYLYQQIINVTLSVLVDGSVTTQKLFQGTGSEAVTTATMRDNAVTTPKITNSAVTTSKLADSSVTTEKINNGAVITDKLGSKSVTTGKIADGAVTATQISDSAVTNTKLGNDAVETSKIKDLNVTTGKLAEGAVTTSKVADNAITHAKTSGVQSQHSAVQVTIPSGATSQTVSVQGVTANNSVIVTPSASSFADWRNLGVRCSAQGEGTLTFVSDVALTNSLIANVLILN